METIDVWVVEFLINDKWIPSRFEMQQPDADAAESYEKGLGWETRIRPAILTFKEQPNDARE